MSSVPSVTHPLGPETLSPALSLLPRVLLCVPCFRPVSSVLDTRVGTLLRLLIDPAQSGRVLLHSVWDKKRDSVEGWGPLLMEGGSSADSGRWLKGMRCGTDLYLRFQGNDSLFRK